MKEKDQISEMEELVIWQEALKNVEEAKEILDQDEYIKIIIDIQNRIDKLLMIDKQG